MLPEAGGYYVYARRAFGNTVGFAVGWSDWLTYCAVLGYVSIAIGEFAALLLPSFGGRRRGIAILSLSALAATRCNWPACASAAALGDHDGREMRGVPDGRGCGHDLRSKHPFGIRIGARQASLSGLIVALQWW